MKTNATENHSHGHAHGDGDHQHDEGHEHGVHEHDSHEGHSHDESGGLVGWIKHTFAHSHDAHEKVDAALETSERGIWAIKISLVGLGLTALAQVVIVAFSGSTALLADTIHNFADAGTSIPLWIAFVLMRRGTNRRFTYGYGRAEDVAGIIIVLVILFSGILAGYESLERVINPEPMTHLWWVAGAAVVGFIGNEAVAQFRIRIGREIGSAALVADGQHSRVDGFTSLAVLGGVIGTWMGYPILDPIIGLGISAAILVIVWQAGRSVLLRVMDGIEPALLDRIEEAAGAAAPEVAEVGRVRARYVGHKVRAEVDVAVHAGLSVEEAHAVAHRVEAALQERVAGLAEAHMHVSPSRSEHAEDKRAEDKRAEEPAASVPAGA